MCYWAWRGGSAFKLPATLPGDLGLIFNNPATYNPSLRVTDVLFCSPRAQVNMQAKHSET